MAWLALLLVGVAATVAALVTAPLSALVAAAAALVAALAGRVAANLLLSRVCRTPVGDNSVARTVGLLRAAGGAMAGCAAVLTARVAGVDGVPWVGATGAVVALAGLALPRAWRQLREGRALRRVLDATSSEALLAWFFDASARPERWAPLAVVVLMNERRPADALELVEAVVARAERVGHTRRRWLRAIVQLALLARQRGRARAALDALEADDGPRVEVEVERARLLAYEGSGEEALAKLDGLMDEFGVPSERSYVAADDDALIRAHALASVGRTADARLVLSRLSDPALALTPEGPASALVARAA